jgi:hypothetical protein
MAKRSPRSAVSTRVSTKSFRARIEMVPAGVLRPLRFSLYFRTSPQRPALLSKRLAKTLIALIVRYTPQECWLANCHSPSTSIFRGLAALDLVPHETVSNWA